MIQPTSTEVNFRKRRPDKKSNARLQETLPKTITRSMKWSGMGYT